MPESNQDNSPLEEVCRGAPRWITPAVLRETIEALNAHYGGKLTPADALEICSNAGQLFRLLRKREQLDKVEGRPDI